MKNKKQTAGAICKRSGHHREDDAYTLSFCLRDSRMNAFCTFGTRTERDSLKSYPPAVFILADT